VEEGGAVAGGGRRHGGAVMRALTVLQVVVGGNGYSCVSMCFMHL
jgi:hypothetical protein